MIPQKLDANEFRSWIHELVKNPKNLHRVVPQSVSYLNQLIQSTAQTVIDNPYDTSFIKDIKIIIETLKNNSIKNDDLDNKVNQLNKIILKKTSPIKVIFEALTQRLANIYTTEEARHEEIKDIIKEFNSIVKSLHENEDIDSAFKLIWELRKSVPEVEIKNILHEVESQVLNVELNAWIIDVNATGEKEKAAIDIKRVFKYGDTSLRLVKLGLNKLPKSLCLLDLKYLYVSKNNLVTLLPEIEHLKNLETLDLIKNQLKVLPIELGNLTKLKTLSLTYNELVTLPYQIGQLTHLEFLFIDYNYLTMLPQEIRNLTQLKAIDVSDNEIKALPSELGYLMQLTSFSFHENSELQELPLSLGSIPGLTQLDIGGTAIPWAIANAILVRCQSIRENLSHETFPLRLNIWKTIGKSEHNLINLVEILKDQDKGQINEWLNRLERTKDFSSRTPLQAKLAKTACDMLAFACQNQSFKEIFITQISLNNEDCMDRSAMAFNELYTSYRIMTIENETISEKLVLLERAAKTAALHVAIAEKIDKEEKENHRLILEGVEIYLYYETKLRKELNLLSAIETMVYTDIGKRHWIQENELIESVEKNYKKHLIQLDAFKKIIATYPSFKVASDKINDKFQQRIEVLMFQLGHAELRLNQLQAIAKRAKVTEKDIADANHVVLTLKTELGEINLQRDQELAQLALKVFDELKAAI